MPIPAFLLAATKLPFIGGVIRHFAPNLRLVVEYVLIGLLLTVSAVTVHLWFSNHSLIKSNKELTVRVANNEALLRIQEDSIKTLSSARENDRVAMKALEDDNDKLDAAFKAHRKRVTQLEKENEAIRSYLAGRIPPELACLLNRTCPDSNKGGGAPPERKPAVLMPSGVRRTT